MNEEKKKSGKSSVVMVILFMLIMFGSGFIFGAVYVSFSYEPVVVEKTVTVTETEYIYENLENISLKNLDPTYHYSDNEILELCTAMQAEDLKIYYKNAISSVNVQIYNVQVEIAYLNNLIALANDDVLVELLNEVLETYQEIQDEQLNNLAYYMDTLDFLDSIESNDISNFFDDDNSIETDDVEI